MLHKKHIERMQTMNSDILRYSIQLAMLKQLLIGKFINTNEYFRIKNILMKDYKVSSDLTC